MTDWVARANALIRQKPPTPTDKTDETPVSSVSSVRPEGSALKTAEGFVGFVGAPQGVHAENASANPCLICSHGSVHRNCTRPVEAGVVERFMLVKHPAGGAGCRAFTTLPAAMAARVEALLAAGALDAVEVDLVRLGYADAPEEWDQLLAAVERTRRVMAP